MTIDVQYFALFREQRGLSEERLETEAATAEELYLALRARHDFRLPVEMVRVAINGEYREMASPLREGDQVVFVPPVAGG
jgi:molybdopterin converting factor subunit 1